MSDAPRVVVIGAGTMGAGIAQAFAAVGSPVVLVDPSAEVLDRALARIRDGLGRQWRDLDDVASRVESALDRVEIAHDVPNRDDVDLAIEAVPEDIVLKRQVLGIVDERLPNVPVVASNTSSLSITKLGDALEDPARFVGMHFFNPVPRSNLIEVVTAPTTSDEVLAAAGRWAELLDKTAIVVRDAPGFATSRLGVAIGLEAIRMVEEGVASPEDIDRGMTLGYKHPIGPLRLTDMVGLDVRLGIAEHLARELGPRFEPPELLRRMVRDGKLGQKSGEGFYRWD